MQGHRVVAWISRDPRYLGALCQQSVVLGARAGHQRFGRRPREVVRHRGSEAGSARSVARCPLLMCG